VKLLREGVEDHLAQDKDLERRRELSRSHAQAAKDAAREAFRPGEQGLVARRGALREVAIALSFLPSNEDAARLLSELMRKPPTVVPAELAAEKEKREEERRRRYLASVSRFALGTLFFLPASVVAGVIDDRLFALDLGLWSLAGLSAHGMSRRPRVEESAVLVPALFAYGGLLGILPVMGCLAPFMIVISALLVDVHLELVRRSVVHRRVAVLLSLGFLGATFLLQKYGYVSAAIDFGGDEIRVMSKMLRFDPKTGPPMLALATMVSVAFFYRRMWVVQQQLGDAEDQEELAQWQWRQLIPPAPAGTNPAEPKAP
jgi:hypothetical protein